MMVAWLAVVNTAFAFTSWNRTLRTPTAVESSIIDGTMLGQIVRLAWLFSSERLRWPPGLGLSVAAGGTYIVHIRRRQRGAGLATEADTWYDMIKSVRYWYRHQ